MSHDTSSTTPRPHPDCEPETESYTEFFEKLPKNDWRTPKGERKIDGKDMRILKKKTVASEIVASRALSALRASKDVILDLEDESRILREKNKKLRKDNSRFKFSLTKMNNENNDSGVIWSAEFATNYGATLVALDKIDEISIEIEELEKFHKKKAAERLTTRLADVTEIESSDEEFDTISENTGYSFKSPISALPSFKSRGSR